MTSRVPVGYHLPTFPSLYNPVHDNGEASYLYYKKDIWRFTLLWTLILYAGVYLAVAICAVLVQWRNWRIIWVIPLGYCIIAGLEGLLAGSVVGLILGAVYEAGNVTMSTWTPFLWAAINVLVVILSSFPMQGAI